MSALTKSIMTGPVTAKLPQSDILMINGKWDISKSERNNKKVLVYNYQIPDNQLDSGIFCMETYWSDFEVALDNSILYSYKDNYRDLGEKIHFVELPNNYRGKVLSLYIYYNDNVINDEKMFNCNAFIGCNNGVYIEFFRENLFALIFGIIALVMTLITFGVAAYFRNKLSVSLFRAGIWLGFYILCAGIWTVTDSKIMLLVSNKVGMITLISFLSFFCMPVIITQFVQEMLNDRKKMLDVICGLEIGIATLYLINYALSLIRPFIFIALTHICILIALILLMKYCIQELKQRHNIELKRIVQGIAVFAIFIVISLIVYYQNPLAHYSYVYANGLLVFVIFLISAAIEKSYEYMEQSAEAKVYKKLALADEMTFLGNRRAFLEKYHKGNPKIELVYIVMDVNNLKAVNDKLGHQKGDELIIAAAQHIKRVFGKEGYCYRIGGDEFIVILEGEKCQTVEEKIEKMLQEIKAGNQEREYALEIAVGYARRKSPLESTEDIFRRADRNMYKNKQKMKKETK